MITTKIKVVVLLLITSALTSFAQITVGAKTGLNLNQFRQPGTSVGASLGAYAAYQPLSFLTVRFEPQYSQQGGARPDYARYYDEIGADLYSVTFINPNIKFHNLEIPLLVELSLPEFTEETIKPKFILGLSYAMTMSAQEIHTKRYQFIEDNGNSTTYDYIDVSYQRENVTDNYKRNQWSFYAGLGMDFKVGTRTFSFDVRYRKGLNNINQLRFTSPQDYHYSYNNSGYIGTPGTGGKLFSSTVSLNFSMSVFTF